MFPYVSKCLQMSPDVTHMFPNPKTKAMHQGIAKDDLNNDPVKKTQKPAATNISKKS